MDSHVLNLATPAIVADLHPSGAQLLWIVDGYVFLVAGALLAMGALGDRVGRRRILLVGATVFSAAALAAAFARSPGELIAARLLMGLAGASLMPSTLALIRTMFADRRQRAVAIGVWTASFSLGGLIGPVAGGALLTHFWWGSVFLPAVPATILLLTLGPRLLPEFRPDPAARFDTLGAAQSLIALLAMVYAVKRAAEGGGTIEVGAAFLGGAVTAIAFVRRQRRTSQPMINPAPFRATGVRIALAANTLTFFTLYATQVAVAQYLQWSLGLTALQAGLWTLPSVLAYLAASALGPFAVRRFSSATVIVAGLSVIAAGCGLFALVALSGPASPTDLALIVAGGSLFSIGLGPVYAVSTEMIVSSGREQQAGSAAAVAETGAELGGALGIALLGSLGVAVYRHVMSDVAGLPPDAVAEASRTAGDATALAATLPGAQGVELLLHARTAFETAFATIGATATVIMAAMAALTWFGMMVRGQEVR
ncbi:MFS transporter [Actinoplanes sp. NEAU-A11]|uniref:MFS transporter n=2 Tax=Actinoplanes aureus TaxID=2792083 RepID=A0A931FXR4_9ACTN|nr:MFS transporter [Actinoplanes aureus]